MDVTKNEEDLQSSLHNAVTVIAHEYAANYSKSHGDISVVEEEKQLGECYTEAIDQYMDRLRQAIGNLVDDGTLRGNQTLEKHLLELLETKTQGGIQTDRLPQEEFGMSNEVLLSIYENASARFTNKNYLEASNIFLFLTLLNPLIASFWIGLGMAEEEQQNDIQAAMAYLMALDRDDDNLEPALYAAQCLLKSNHQEQALQILELALEKAGDTPRQRVFKEEVMSLKQTIKI